MFKLIILISFNCSGYIEHEKQEVLGNNSNYSQQQADNFILIFNLDAATNPPCSTVVTSGGPKKVEGAFSNSIVKCSPSGGKLISCMFMSHGSKDIYIKYNITLILMKNIIIDKYPNLLSKIKYTKK